MEFGWECYEHTFEQKLHEQDTTSAEGSTKGLLMTEKVTASQWQFPWYIVLPASSIAFSLSVGISGKAGGWYKGGSSAPGNTLVSVFEGGAESVRTCSDQTEAQLDMARKEKHTAAPHFPSTPLTFLDRNARTAEPHFGQK